MVAEHWLLIVPLLILPVSKTLDLRMAAAPSTMGSTQNPLGNFFKLQPPPVTEVTPENYPEWNYKVKNYVATMGFRLAGIFH